MFLFIVMGVLTIFYRLTKAAFGTFIVCLIIVPIVLFCPSWELVPWIRQHAFSLFLGTFVIHLILLANDHYLPTAEQMDEDEEEDE